jgi:hypothetical protein
MSFAVLKLQVVLQESCSVIRFGIKDFICRFSGPLNEVFVQIEVSETSSYL